MPDEGLWFIREGAELDLLDKWQVWFRPVRDGERPHSHFPTRHQAQAVVDTLNALSFTGIRPDPEPSADTSRQGDGEPRPLEANQRTIRAEQGTTEADKGYS